MPIYTLQGPDGKTYDVEGPEGATAEQLGAFIQQNMRSAPDQAGHDVTIGTGVNAVTLHYDDKSPPSGESDVPQEKPGMIASLGAALGHGMGEGVLGAQQFAGHTLSALGADKVGGWLSNDAEQGLKRIDAEYAPYASANPTTSSIGNVVGNVGGMVAGGELAGIAKLGALAGKAGQLIPKIGRFIAPIANTATQGAAYGAMAPVRNGDYWQQAGENAALGSYLGGGASALMGAGAAAVRNIRGAVAPLINPERYVGRNLASMIGDDAQSVLNNINNAPTFVPGSMPTTAQAGAHPVLVATEKAAGNAGPFKVAQVARENANNEARWQALMGVAKTPGEMDAAMMARADAAQPLYDAAHSQTANVGRGFINFAQRPAVTKAMQLADQLARNEGVTLKWPTPTDRAISGHALDYTRRALGDMIDSAKSSGNKQLARALTQSRDYLSSWTNQYIPGMQTATQRYAEMSVPVNTMQAGQDIANSLGNKAMNSGGIPNMTLPGYRQALSAALKKQPFGIEGGAHGTLQGIGQDLQRASISNSIRSPGSDTAYNLSADGWLARNLYGKNFGGATNLGRAGAAVGAGLGTALTGHPWLGIGAAGGVLKGAGRVGEWAGRRLQSALADALLDPQVFRPYLEEQITRAAAAGSQSKARALAQALQGDLVPAISVGGPALLNQR